MDVDVDVCQLPYHLVRAELHGLTRLGSHRWAIAGSALGKLRGYFDRTLKLTTMVVFNMLPLDCCSTHR